MKYDFDRHVDRVHTNDMKWDSKAVEAYLHRTLPTDIIPMWVADTEFACAPVIVEAIKQRADKEIFGYCIPGKSFYQAVCQWQKRRFSWEIKPEWITVLPTVVAGINVAIRSFSEKGDGVIIQQPVYDPFATIIENTGRRVINNELVEKNGTFVMNFEELESLAAQPDNKVMILCSPHNPVGRVWKKEELETVVEICSRNHVILVSDEIHSDIVFSGHKHLPLLSLDDSYAEHIVLLTAPGKAFNVAGLKVSNAIIASEKLRSAFQRTQIQMSLDVKNTFGLECIEAAYTEEGEEWLKEEIQYMEENVKYVEQRIQEEFPNVELIKPEGTFLCWLNLKEMHLSDEELFQRILEQAGVICVPGPWFGEGGEQHMRLNIGCPRQMLKDALDKMKETLYQ